MKPVPVRVMRVGIQQHAAVPDKFSTGDSQGKFVVKEDRYSQLNCVNER
jgi:hypothetical protein